MAQQVTVAEVVDQIRTSDVERAWPRWKNALTLKQCRSESPTCDSDARRLNLAAAANGSRSSTQPGNSLRANASQPWSTSPVLKRWVHLLSIALPYSAWPAGKFPLTV